MGSLVLHNKATKILGFHSSSSSSYSISQDPDDKKALDQFQSLSFSRNCMLLPQIKQVLAWWISCMLYGSLHVDCHFRNLWGQGLGLWFKRRWLTTTPGILRCGGDRYVYSFDLAWNVFVMFSFHSLFRVNHDAACDLDSTKYHAVVPTGELIVAT